MNLSLKMKNGLLKNNINTVKANNYKFKTSF